MYQFPCRMKPGDSGEQGTAHHAEPFLSDKYSLRCISSLFLRLSLCKPRHLTSPSFPLSKMSLEHANEKPSQGDTINVAADTDPEQTKEGLVEDYEVFQKTEDGVDFRTVGWFKASVIFCKVMFAVGVLSLPTTMSALGAVGGSLSIVAWGAFNTYCFVILGDFRQRHPGCHSIADMAYVVGGVVTKELTGFLFIVAYVLCAGAGIIGVATGLNALSHHATCTVWYALVATIVCALTASVRKLHQFGWLTYAGFASVYIAVLIVVIGVTQRDRPAAAPQTGPYELGYYAIAYPSFASGMVASSTIFYSSAGTSAFLPVISEMRNPKDYKKALYVCMTIVTASYLCFSLVVYRWCGQWVASPSLGVSHTHATKAIRSR